MYTDSAEHPLSWFKAVYRDATITEENYQEEYDKGLYKFIPGLEIIPGWQKITFTYYADDAKILAIESVPIMYDGPKGEPGEQGPRAPQYFGLFKPASPEEGDWYLDAATGYVQEYRSGAWHNLDYESNSSKYMAAINDAMGSLQLSDDTLPMVKAMTAWINNLTANYAFIKKLFAKKITLQEGGVFKSANYNGSANNMQMIDNIPDGTPIALDNNGTEGVAIDSFGHLDVVNMNATGGTFNDVRITGSLNASHGVKYANNIIKRGSVKDTENNPIFNFLQAVNSQLRAEMYGNLACGGQIVFTIGNNSYYIYFHLAYFYADSMYLSNYELSCNMAFGCVVNNFNYFTGYSNNPQVNPFNFASFKLTASDIQGREKITVNIGRNSYDENQIANIYLEMHY